MHVISKLLPKHPYLLDDNQFIAKCNCRVKYMMWVTNGTTRDYPIWYFIFCRFSDNSVINQELALDNICILFMSTH